MRSCKPFLVLLGLSLLASYFPALFWMPRFDWLVFLISPVALPLLIMELHWLVCILAYLLIVAVLAWCLSDSELAFLVLPAVLFTSSLMQGLLIRELIRVFEIFPLPM